MKERHRLNRILRLKERLRDAESGRLATAEAHHRDADAQVRDKEAQIADLGRGLTAAGEVSAREMANRASLHARAMDERIHLARRRAEAAQARDLQAAELTRAARELRRFEVLDARYARREREDALRREQAQLDESARRLVVSA